MPSLGLPSLDFNLLLLGPGQTPHFTRAESNANEGEQRVVLICILFGSCEVQCLTPALVFRSVLREYLHCFPVFIVKLEFLKDKEF